MKKPLVSRAIFRNELTDSVVPNLNGKWFSNVGPLASLSNINDVPPICRSRTNRYARMVSIFVDFTRPVDHQTPFH